jgi:hypothetical protein
MKKVPLVIFIPSNRNNHIENFKEWCISNISYYSTEVTWIYHKGDTLKAFSFGEEMDLLAFKMRFGL